MNSKKGITLIALAITIIVLVIIATISIAAITNENVLERARQVRQEKRLNEAKETIKAALFKVIGLKKYKNQQELADDVEAELKKMKGLESVIINPSGDDYKVEMPNDISLTFEEVTGKKLQMHIDSYVTLTEIEGR